VEKVGEKKGVVQRGGSRKDNTEEADRTGSTGRKKGREGESERKRTICSRGGGKKKGQEPKRKRGGEGTGRGHETHVRAGTGRPGTACAGSTRVSPAHLLRRVGYL